MTTQMKQRKLLLVHICEATILATETQLLRKYSSKKAEEVTSELNKVN